MFSACQSLSCFVNLRPILSTFVHSWYLVVNFLTLYPLVPFIFRFKHFIHLLLLLTTFVLFLPFVSPREIFPISVSTCFYLSSLFYLVFLSVIICLLLSTCVCLCLLVFTCVCLGQLVCTCVRFCARVSAFVNLCALPGSPLFCWWQ